jgi:hypothetical protein
MIKRDGKCPKLRSKAAECRYLVPFCAWLSDKFKAFNQHFAAIAGMFFYLHQLQMMVSGSEPWVASSAADACRLFCSLYAALSAEAKAAGKDRWRIKPKLHLLQEMLEVDVFLHGNPSEFWNYRDESFVGFWAGAAHRRGGPNLVATTTRRFLDRFRAMVD